MEKMMLTNEEKKAAAEGTASFSSVLSAGKYVKLAGYRRYLFTDSGH